MESPATMKERRRHFRTLLMVDGNGRKRYYFRFYDPRVLRVFLPICTSEELNRFVGPVTAFYCESTCRNALLAFKFAPGG